MQSFSIRGFQVSFPHQPYGVQFSFMEKMLRTLDEQGNALLEAPTGCGKTLSLLCAALAWQEARKAANAAAAAQAMFKADAKQQASPEGAAAGDDADGPLGDPLAQQRDDGMGEDDEQQDKPRTPKIFFATRTHSQIAQVVRELKRTSYKPSMAILVRTGCRRRACARLVGWPCHRTPMHRPRRYR